MKKIRILLYLNLFLIILSCSKDNIDEVVNMPQTPKLLTNQVTDISIYSIKISGKLLDKGSSEVTELGFVVDTSNKPTISQNLNKSISQVDSNGDFYIVFRSIPPNTTLYFRSYAINSNGVGYGNEIVFTTLPEKIFNGDVTLTTQQEVDAFGLNKYTTIQGELNIHGNISNLNSLNDLVMVNGDLYIQYTNLLNLNGLNNVKIFGNGGINHISNNPLLINFDGLNNLDKVKGEFYILQNQSLINCQGLNKLKSVAFGELNINGNPNLENLSGLNNLTVLSSDLVIANNSTLSSINDLNHLSIINNGLIIANNPLLQNLNGLENIKNVESINIDNNSLLTNLNGLNNLEKVDWIIRIENNNNLINLNGLEKIIVLGPVQGGTCYLVINNNPNLINLNGLDNIIMYGSEPYRIITVTNNINLANFCSLKKIFLNTQNINLTINNNLINPNINFILNNCL